jgi:ABC-type cobalamin/Fe3+-siderophores transport system ATPase subunit
MVAIMGPLVSGKSTLMAILAAWILPPAATYLVDDKDTSRMKEEPACPPQSAQVRIRFPTIQPASANKARWKREMLPLTYDGTKVKER